MGRPLALSDTNKLFIHPGRSVLPTLVMILVLGGVAATAGAQDGITVLASDRNHVRLGSGDLQSQWVERDIAGVSEPYYDLKIPGFANIGEPGGPRTPRLGAWLVVPPGTRPVLKNVSEQWEDAGGRRLMVEGVPMLLPGEDEGSRFMSEIVVPYGRPLPAGMDVPGDVRAKFLARGNQSREQALTLGEVSWWRGRRLVSVLLVPVLHDGQGRASQVLKNGVWEIDFVPAEKGTLGKAPGPERTSARGDSHFGSIFLNADLLKTTLPESAFPGEAAGQKTIPEIAKRRGTLLGPETRLVVKSTRLQRVTAARLRERGLLPDTPVPEADVRLYQRRYIGPTGAGSMVEIEIPILMVGDGGNFEGDDFFVFYGLRMRDDGPYTADFGDGPVDIPGCGDPHEMTNDGNIYWLAAAQPPTGETWARMARTTLPEVTGTPLTAYRRSEHIEEQIAFRENEINPREDRVFENSYGDTDASISLNTLWSPDPDGQEARIKVGYSGVSVSPRLLRFDLYVDNVLVQNLASEVYLASMTGQTRSFPIPAGLLAGSSAKIVMSRDESAADLSSYLNWVEVEYDAHYLAQNNTLVFNTGQGSGERPVEVDGFADADLGLIDISDPHNPVAVDLQAANIKHPDDTYTLSISPEQDFSPRVFEARGDWHGEGIGEFSYIPSRLVTDPVDPSELSGPEPDLLVVSHGNFKQAIGRWIDHRIARAGGNLNVKLVDVQDLYDHYSGGMRDAWAIKRFTAEAIARWGSWALEIVGDANENARELKVPTAAKGWATDFVPAHYHVQGNTGYAPELLASDKWYATSEAGMDYPTDDFPARVYSPWEMYVGRFPCNNVDELNTMIDKVITVESPQPGQDWRRRGIFFADDSWSNGYGLDALSKLTYRSNEDVFTSSTRDSLAHFWRDVSPVTLEADTLFLGDYLDPLWPQGESEDRTISKFIGYAEQYALQPLLQALNRGGLVCFYQGHANQYVLCSEYWIQDQPGNTNRRDVAAMNNAQAPWFFFGLGCHISDWAQNTVSAGTNPKERSLSEKMMIRSGGGASGTYGSSGYEYIAANRAFGEKIFRRWMFHPPVFDGVQAGNTQPLPGRALAPRSRWMIGELMWASEADIQAILGGDSIYREMISQYTLLGDPLMILDAGEPVVTAAFADDPGTPLTGTVDVRDIDGSNVRTLDIVARDEAGIDHLRFYDSEGSELTAGRVSESLPPGQTDQQEVHYTVDVPLRPFAHTMTIEVFDTGAPLPTDRHWALNLKVAMDAEILADGQPLDPATFTFTQNVPVDFSLAITSSASLSEAAVFTLGAENLDLSGVVITRQDAHDLNVRFTATTAGTDQDLQRAVHLSVNEGSVSRNTTYVLQDGASGSGDLALGRVLNFPNPMADRTRFVIETNTGGRGVIRVFSVAGRVVASIPVDLPGGGSSGIVTWDGRDSRGDELANGTYLYRVELEGTGGRVVSDMQRLVMMR